MNYDTMMLHGQLEQDVAQDSIHQKPWNAFVTCAHGIALGYYRSTLLFPHLVEVSLFTPRIFGSLYHDDIRLVMYLPLTTRELCSVVNKHL
jgi:hypothetical protein